MPSDLAVFDSLTLSGGRIHEFTGPARLAAVVALLAQAQRPSLWILGRPESRPNGQEELNLEGLLDLGMIPPEALALARTPLDALWSSEQALRSGCGLVVVADLAQPLDLTSSRRLQLAAEAGQALGLCLVPDAPQSTASETRWHCAPSAGTRTPEDSTEWRWRLIKNKKGTPAQWTVSPHVSPRTHTSADPTQGDGSPAHHLRLVATPAH
jgi:protein ImuA